MSLNVEVSAGELLDKITILEIKSERMDDPAKLANVRTELDTLRDTWQASPLAARDIADQMRRLKAVNERLWDIEDAIRRHEADGDFGDDFVQLARSVYFSNDERAAIKRELNEMLGSRLVEEKSYADYGDGA
jgi:predicted  nucleic acid-binding Zn-ribbon protein